MATTPQPLPLPAASVSRSRSGVRILLAEDNEINRIVATKMLEKLGYPCEVVENGKLAVESVSRERYDLVLMDCEMPEMDGLTATRNIRLRESKLASDGQEPRHVPIIALTAHAGQEDREAGLAAGMDAYLSKPIELPALDKIIRETLDHQAAPSEPEPNRPAAPPAPAASAASPPAPVAAAGELPIDTQSLLRRCMGKPILAAELLDCFATSAKNTLTVLEQHLDAENSDSFARAAHTLKGSALSMSADGVRRCALRLEELGRQGCFEEARRELANLAVEVQRCLAFLPQAKEALSAVNTGTIGQS